MNNETTTAAAPVRAIDRAFQILLEISREEDGLTAVQLSQRTELPLSTVYRLVDSLQVRGFVTEGLIAGHYAVGPTAHEVGSSYRGREYLVEASNQVMGQLAQQTGETANLGMIDAGRVVYVHQVDSPGKLMRMHVEHGVALPVHCSGVGKVLLAWSGEYQAQRLREAIDFRPFTPRTITTVRQLDFALEQAREAGYAMDDEEREAGVRCVAVPVFHRAGTVTAALSVSGPASRVSTQRIPELVEQLQSAANEITRRLTSQESRGTRKP